MLNKPLYRTPEGQREVMEYYDRVLEHWPVEHSEIRIQTRIGETFLIVSGPVTGEPVFLLHGAGSNALAWMGDIVPLAQHYRVYAADIPGDPGRSAPSRPAWNGTGYGDWLQDILEALQIPQAVLIGLSQGGWLALKFAVYRPARVSRLVLLSPAGVINDRPSFLFKAIGYSLAGKKGAAALTRLTFGGMPVPPEATVFQELILTHFHSRIEKLRLFSEAELARLTMPVLLIGGRRDVIRDVDKIRARLAPFLPQLEARIHPDQGHVLISQSETILPFLAGTPAGGAVK